MLKGTDLGPEDPDPTWEHQAKTPGLEGKELKPSAHMETEPEGKLQCGAASKTWEWGQHWLWNKPLSISSKSSGLLAAMQKQQGHLAPAGPPHLTTP